jgi:hypothetical protein
MHNLPDAVFFHDPFHRHIHRDDGVFSYLPIDGYINTMLRLATIAACSIAQRATILDMGVYPDPPVPNQPVDL